MAKKKNKNLGPKRKRLNRKNRLQQAETWVNHYKGNNLVKTYAKWYGIDKIGAIKELEMLGHTISSQYKEQVRADIERIARERQEKKAQLLEEDVADLEIDMLFGDYTNELPFEHSRGEDLVEILDFLGQEGFSRYHDRNIMMVDEKEITFVQNMKEGAKIGDEKTKQSANETVKF